MINPLTFDTQGNPENLTWARDLASVQDAVFSARTLSEPLSRVTHPEAVSRGSNPVYVTDLQATIERPDVLKIKVLRFYIAGRYVEVLNEDIKGVLDIDNGNCTLTVSAYAWRDDNQPNISIPGSRRGNDGQIGGEKAINDLSRAPETRQGKRSSIFGIITLFWEKPDTSVNTVEEVFVSAEHTSTLTNFKGDTNPYLATMMEPASIHLRYPTTLFEETDIHREHTVNGFTYFSTIGDNSFGGFVVSSTPNNSYDQTFFDTFTKHYKEQRERKPAHRLFDVANGDATLIKKQDAGWLQTNLFGITSKSIKDSLPTRKTLTLNQFLDTLSNYRDKWHPRVDEVVDVRQKISSDEIGYPLLDYNLKGFDNVHFPVFKGVDKVNKLSTSNPLSGVDQLNLDTLDDVLSHTFELLVPEVELTNNDVFLTVDKVETVTSTSITSAKYSNAIVYPYNHNYPSLSDKPDVFVFDVSASMKRHDFKIDHNGSIVDVPFSNNSIVSYHDRKIIVPVQTIPYFTKINTNDVTSDKIRRFANTEQVLEKLRDEGINETEFWREFLKPIVALEMLRIQYEQMKPEIWEQLVYIVKSHLTNLKGQVGTVLLAHLGTHQNKALLQ